MVKTCCNNHQEIIAWLLQADNSRFEGQSMPNLSTEMVLLSLCACRGSSLLARKASFEEAFSVSCLSEMFEVPCWQEARAWYV
jgi:hypothetical protein